MNKILLLLLICVTIILIVCVNIFNRVVSFQQDNNIFMYKVGIELGCLHATKKLDCKQISELEAEKLKRVIK